MTRLEVVSGVQGIPRDDIVDGDVKPVGNAIQGVTSTHTVATFVQRRGVAHQRQGVRPGAAFRDHHGIARAYQVASDVVNINEVINETLALVQHDLKQQKIELNLDLRSTVSVSGNHQQFQQVLINLLVNAMNAQETAGMITVRTRNWRDQGVLMVVRDNGRGISAEALPRIFDPFYTQTKSGTGLGLYVSSGILNRYGAEILVRSRVGVGSCFFVWFYCDSVQQRDNSIKTDKEVY